MQEKLYFGKITTATPKSVLFKICSQGIRNIIVFSFPVPGFTPIRHLGVPLFRRKFHQISWIYKAFLKECAICYGISIPIFAEIVGLPDVELEWTLALGTRKLLYFEDVVKIFWIELTWESLSWFFQNFIFPAWFLKDSRESHFSAEKSRKTAHRSHVVHISENRFYIDDFYETGFLSGFYDVFFGKKNLWNFDHFFGHISYQNHWESTQPKSISTIWEPPMTLVGNMVDMDFKISQIFFSKK